MEWAKCFRGWIYLFIISSNSGGITLTISLPDIVGTTIQDVGPLTHSHAAWRPHNEQWTYTSNLVQYISGFEMNINDEIRPQYITLYDS